MLRCSKNGNKLASVVSVATWHVATLFTVTGPKMQTDSRFLCLFDSTLGGVNIYIYIFIQIY